MNKDDLPQFGLPASGAIWPQTGKGGWERDCERWHNAQQAPYLMESWCDSAERSLEYPWHDQSDVQGFYDRLHTGELVAFGIPEPMPPAGGYVEIDPSRWAVLRIPDWMVSTAIGGGAVYHLCLFYRRADVDAWRPAPGATKKTATAAPRRTLKENVYEAMKQADASDPGWRTRHGAWTALGRDLAEQEGAKLSSVLATMRKIGRKRI